jgi:glycosyltransferase involved in cell wall biosynthesis
MRILILSFYFPPDLSAGSFRTNGLIEALHRVIGPDDRVEVLTTQPNRYASYVQSAASEETQGQISVRRFSLPAHRGGFADQSLAFVAYAYQVLKATRRREYDVVFATSSRLFTAALGALIASQKRAPLYLDIRDIFVDTLQDVLSAPTARFMLPVFRLIEKSTMSRAAHINLVSEGFLGYFQARYPKVRYSVISNGIDEVFVRTSFVKEDGGGKKIVLYAGNIGEGQGLERVIPGLAKALSNSHEFWIVGDGGQRSLLEAAAGELSNLKLMPPVSRSELVKLYGQSDVLFLHLNDYPAFHKVLPSKLFEYAATGKPIVAGVAGYAASFLKDIPGVSVFRPCNVDEAATAIGTTSDGPVSRMEFVERYRRTRLMGELADSILSVAIRGASPR